MSVVRIERNERVAEVVLDRPEKLNAFNPELFADYAQALREVDADQSVSVVIVRGEGRAFSVGWDVTRPADSGDGARAHRTAHQDWDRLRPQLRAFSAVFDLSKPVVSSVHGFCMGGATLIPVCSDLAVVGEQTTIGWPVLPIGGGMLGPMTSYSVGSKKGRELSYTAGARMTGPEAAAYGWANYCVPESEVLGKARELAYEISKTPLDMLEIKKLAANDVLIRQGFRETLEECPRWDALIHSSAGNMRMNEVLAEMGISAARAWYADGGSLRAPQA